MATEDKYGVTRRAVPVVCTECGFAIVLQNQDDYVFNALLNATTLQEFQKELMLLKRTKGPFQALRLLLFHRTFCSPQARTEFILESIALIEKEMQRDRIRCPNCMKGHFSIEQEFYNTLVAVIRRHACTA